jgi:hypothetical protein
MSKEQYLCKSYYDDNNILQDCTCGNCGKAEILTKIKGVQFIKGKNSMGTSESWYDPYYLIKNCFSENELSEMNTKELANLVKLAEKASEVFY